MSLTHVWANTNHTMVLRSDGANIPADPRNGDFAALTASGAEIGPFQRWSTLAEAKADLTADVEARAAAMRVAVAGTSDATKLTVYQRKYDVAVRAIANDAAAIATLTPEATARGETVAALAVLVKSLGDAWAAAGLAIDAAYQAHKAAIAALANIAQAEAYDTGAGWPG